MAGSTKNEAHDHENLVTTPIAIVGMASIFPKATHLSEYWDNILKKIDCLTDVPESRWSIADYYDPNPAAPDKTYCKRGGFIPDVDFDPLEFGLPPNILEVTDVSQLLGLVVARDALADAGYSEERAWSRDKTGVILGVVGMSSKLFQPLMSRLQYPIWEKALRSSGVSEEDTQKIVQKIKAAYVGWEENAFPGAIGNVIAGRIANRFDLGGTNCVVDAACGSSLAAVRLAVGELVMGRADMMITGGVDTDNSIVTYLCFSKTPAFSKSGNLRPFDAEADGMMAGEGIGMLVLKRLADAERDGDRIYAVIKGVGASSDGRFKSIYAPRAEGQASAVRRAYAEAGYSPATLGLVEAHGTGTNAGDPEEVRALRGVIAAENQPGAHVALGSVKSQIGHTKAAAGAAGLIKVSLALYHKTLPATINVSHPSPKLELDGSPVYLNTETRPWIRPADGTPRRAGVSAFGFGGTNFHIAVEEYRPEHEGAYRLNPTASAVLLSASDPAALRIACADWLAKLNAENAAFAFSVLTEASRTLSIPSGNARVGFVAETPAEAAQDLQVCVDSLAQNPDADAWDNPKGIYYRRNGMDPHGKVVALFPGQGAQYANMGREATVNFPPLRNAFHEMDELFAQDGLAPLSDAVYPTPVFDAPARNKQSENLQRTDHAQPAIGTLSLGFYRLLQQAGFQADFSAGHSFGELVALCAAGVYTEADCFKLAKARGKAMAPPDDPNFDAGTMLAVKGDVEKIRTAIQAFPAVTLANWNSNEQVVLAGTKAEIARVQDALDQQGFSPIPLQVAAAFHTPLVGHAQKPFAAVLEKIPFNPPSINVFSNTTAQPYPSDPGEIRKILAAHILNPVLFKDEIEQIYAAGGRIFVEIGPKSVLTNLVDAILAGQPHLAVAVNPNPKKDSDRQLREAVVLLRVAGLELTGFDPYAAPRKISASRKKSPASVRLNAGLYVKGRVESRGIESSQSVSGESVIGQSVTGQSVNQSTNSQSTNPQSPIPNQPIPLPSPESFQTHQNETVRLHEQYLHIEEEYARAFARLTELQSDLVAKANSGQLDSLRPLFESLERSIAPFHAHQNETLRVHEQFLAARGQLVNGQSVISQSVTGQLGNQSIGQSVDQSPITNPQSTNPQSTILQSLLSIVSDKTGYPVETLEPDMDMESDLGIDSIKRVEILGAMQAQYPDLPRPDAATLAELRTLRQVGDYLGGGSSQSVSGQSVIGQLVTGQLGNQSIGQSIDQSPIPNPQLTDQPITNPQSTVLQSLLSVVSDKTGYPVETLEPDMDMESDLGIDSIKRVEILGAMQAQYPELPRPDAATLAELRTLRQVGEFLGGGSSQSVNGQSVTGQPIDQSTNQPIPNPQSTNPQSPISTSTISLKTLPSPDALEFAFPQGRTCLITDDGSPLTAQLATALQGRGWPVVVLNLPAAAVPTWSDLPEGIARVAVEAMGEESLAARLAEAARSYGPIGTFIHLAPYSAQAAPYSAQAAPASPQGGLTFLDAEKADLKEVFLIAKCLKADLNQAAQTGRAAFVTVTHLDGQFGLGAGGNSTPVLGGLNGLVKTLNLEWENVFCRAIDLSPNLEPEQAVDCVLAELHDPNRLVTEVGYGPQGRCTVAVCTVAVTASAAD
jgi:acyl transferase domain-containing protein